MKNRIYLGNKIAHKIKEIESFNKEIEEYNKNAIIELSKLNGNTILNLQPNLLKLAEITIVEKEYSRSSIILEYILKTLETLLGIYKY